MAVLSRVNFVAQQRLDLNHLLAAESFLAYDFRALLTGFSGLEKPYILRGYEVVGKTGLTLSIQKANSMVFNPLDGNGSFFVGTPDDAEILVDLPADQENVFVQARFRNVTAAPVNTAFWDALALTGEDVAGTEFTASTNTQNLVVLDIEANTVGFDEDAIPILRATTSASAVTKMSDCRQMFFRLGTGGPTPNPLAKFPWSNTRQESIAEGTGVDDEVDSPFRSRDSTGIRNDKGIRSFKEMLDALMTRIAEIAGQSLWYDNSGASSATNNLTLNTLFLDTIGHNIQPDSQTAFTWKRSGGDLVLGSSGQSSVKWQFNYGPLRWELGGTFVSNIAGGSRAYSNVRFSSPAPVDNGNVYLLLERESPKGSGAAVTWSSNSADTNLIETRTVSGVAGDFTGIAIGDYIRKESEGAQRYYRVVQVSDGTTITNTADYICDGTIVAVEVDRDIDSGVTNEPLRFWRSKYSSSDLVADLVVDTYPSQDLNFYWLGRRKGNLFILRGYGTMQEGEEVPVLNDAHLGVDGRAGDLILEHGYGAIYDSGAGYSQAAEGTGSLLTIRRRKRDNTASTPSSSDNSGAYLTYTIASPVGLLAVGQTLWVKLSDTTSGALSAGTVVDATDDTENTTTVTNVWQILDADETPLRTYDNRDVYPICRRVSVSAPLSSDSSVLIFLDGTVLSQNGNYVNNRFNTSGITKFFNDDVHLMTRPATSILFIDDTVVGRIDDDSTNFFYDKTNQIQGTFNYRWGVNTLTLDSPADLDWLANLGSNTLHLGSSDSTIRVRGNFIVLGTTFSEQVQVVQSDDKLITVGVGTLSGSSGGSGIQVADNTIQATQATTINGQDTLQIDFGSAHGYTLGQIVGVSSNTEINGILAGDMTAEYTIVAVATTYGEAEIVDSDTIKIWTNGTATSSGTTALSPPTTEIRCFDVLSWVKLTDSSGTDTGYTSWSFRTKGQGVVTTLTPVSGYGIIPTANSTNMLAGRIPFVNNDNAGPSGVDTTLNFVNNFTWDGTELSVPGNINVNSNYITNLLDPLNPQEAATKAYVDSLDRYTALYEDFTNNTGSLIPAGSVVALSTTVSGEIVLANASSLTTGATIAGVVVSDIADGATGKVQIAGEATVLTTAALTIGARAFLATTSGRATSNAPGTYNQVVFVLGYATATNKVLLATHLDAVNTNVYEEYLTVVSGAPVDSNEVTGPVIAGTNLTLPLDSREGSSVQQYMVGSGMLEVELNGIRLYKGLDYTEVGIIGSQSMQIQMTRDLVVDDVLKFRINLEAAAYFFTSGAGTTLQTAYLAGSTITISSGNPITINGPVSEKLLVINGDIEVTGVIDPKAIMFSPQASNPLPLNQAGFWVNTAGEVMYQKGDSSSPSNVSSVIDGNTPSNSNQSTFTNNSGSSIAAFTPVAINSSGELALINVSVEVSAMSAIGVTVSAINNGNTGAVTSCGVLPNITTSAAFGDPIYVSKTGTLTNVKPSIGVGGFVAEDFIIRVGVIAKNPNNPSNKDLIVNMQIIGQL